MKRESVAESSELKGQWRSVQVKYEEVRREEIGAYSATSIRRRLLAISSIFPISVVCNSLKFRISIEQNMGSSNKVQLRQASCNERALRRRLDFIQLELWATGISRTRQSVAEYLANPDGMIGFLLQSQRMESCLPDFKEKGLCSSLSVWPPTSNCQRVQMSIK